MGTITKALELLNYFARQKPEIGLTEFVRLVDRDKATVHRHLTELTENGFLEQNPVTRAYRLGPSILRLSGVREATHPVRSVLRPVVSEIANAVGELTHVSLIHGDVLSPALHADPMTHGTQVAFDESEMLPLHATSSGLAVLAFAPEGMARRILKGPLDRYADGTITTASTLQAMLDEVRERGTASQDRAFDNEVCSQAAPIFGPDGEVTGAVAIAFPTVRDSDEKRADVRAALCDGMARITHQLGGVVPPEHADKWSGA
ncbi:MAG: IclR family transcriptional regulator [Pseudomonadota bacterium]|nr:IclR family transcriptional regulator [Pseudomonadota bacterium]